jgi:hypothetical protein
VRLAVSTNLILSRSHTLDPQSLGLLRPSLLISRIVPKAFPTGLTAVARRKLVQLNNAVVLSDLAVPPTSWRP